MCVCWPAEVWLFGYACLARLAALVIAGGTARIVGQQVMKNNSHGEGSCAWGCYTLKRKRAWVLHVKSGARTEHESWGLVCIPSLHRKGLLWRYYYHIPWIKSTLLHSMFIVS